MCQKWEENFASCGQYPLILLNDENCHIWVRGKKKVYLLIIHRIIFFVCAPRSSLTINTTKTPFHMPPPELLFILHIFQHMKYPQKVINICVCVSSFPLYNEYGSSWRRICEIFYRFPFFLIHHQKELFWWLKYLSFLLCFLKLFAHEKPIYTWKHKFTE